MNFANILNHHPNLNNLEEKKYLILKVIMITFINILNNSLITGKEPSMKITAILFLLTLFFISSSYAQDNGPESDYEILFNMKEGRIPYSMGPTDDDIYHYDVIHYDIDVEVDFTLQHIYGVVTQTAEATQNSLSTVVIDLANIMNINSLTRDGVPQSYMHQDNQIFIALSNPVNIGEEFNITINYDGQPMSGGLQGFEFDYHAGIPIAATLSEPEEARGWWPCKDVPWDKFTADIRYTVPNTMFAASNGLLIDTIVNPNNTKTYVWQETYPITTYLISLAVTNYVYFGEQYESVYGDSFNLDYYVFPEHLTQAQSAFATVPNVMEYYEQVYGEYPFVNEKYGHAIFMWSGGMEHQTMTSIGYNILSPSYEWLYAHELSHMWWGDMVTCGTWMDIWLNEGFATYSDALYKQYAYGQSQFISRMNSFKQSYFWEDNQNRFPIYDPVNMWGGTVYQKGAWLVHMLRYIGGEDNFWSFWETYRNNFEYSSAVTADLQATFEAVYDTTLDWYFDEWVYMAGYPEYDWGYEYESTGGNNYELRISIEQTQNLINDTPIFTMPLPFRITTTSQTYNTALWDSLQQQMFTLVVEGQPTNVQYDPETWILDTRSQVTYFEPDLLMTLEPDTTSLIIPPGGGQVSFMAELSNNTGTTINTDAWSGAILPNGNVYGPIILRQNIQLAANSSVTRDIIQNVPASAPAGEYTYFFLAGSYPDSNTVAADAFTFIKEN